MTKERYLGRVKQLIRRIELKEKEIFIAFFVLGSVIALSASLNDLDSNFHLDYVREIQRTHSVPVYHPHLFRTEAVQMPFPYPIGYHLAMSVFPHCVPLHKMLGVLFAAVSLFLTFKLCKILGFGDNLAVIIPLLAAFSFSKFAITPHPDMFALMLVLLSVYLTLKYLLEKKTQYAAIAIFAGFYASITREVALMTLLFAWLVLWLKYRESRKRLFWIIVPIVSLAAFGYYLVNCLIREVHFLYPLQGAIDLKAHQWYSAHVSFWSVLSHGYWSQALGEIVKVFSLFIPLFFLIKPQDRTLALAFGCQIALIFILMPSTAGLDRYVMFTLPFLAIAYANAWKKLPKRAPVIILLVGMFVLYPAQGYALEKRFPTNFEGVTENLGPDDFVLFREHGQLAYRVGCRAGWTSLFWSSDLFESFENVDKVENLIEKHGVTHILIDKELILPVDSPMIGDEVIGYPKEWVEKIENIGTKICETQRYVLYQVGSS